MANIILCSFWAKPTNLIAVNISGYTVGAAPQKKQSKDMQKAFRLHTFAIPLLNPLHKFG